MAAPITHIVLAQKIFAQHFRAEDEKSFFVGTSFPDIRYLGVLNRGTTHREGLKWDEVASLSGFEAGFAFHSLVDDVREAFMQASGVYKLLPTTDYPTQALKFYEDSVLYSRLHDWQRVAHFFTDVLPEESAFGVPESAVQPWHDYLRMYFVQGPSRPMIEHFVTMAHQSPIMAEEILRVENVLKETPQISVIINELHDRFETLLGLPGR